MFGISYRPRTFQEIVGQKTVVKGVQSYLTKGNFPQASAFIGTSGCGKSTTARIVAMTLNCQNPKSTENGIEPCGECPCCKDIIDEKFSRSVSVYNGSDVSIDVMRQIQENIKYDSLSDKNTILIFEEAQLIPTTAFKSFLTMIESARKNVYFILTSTDSKKFSNSYSKDNKSQETNALRSRLSLFNIKPITTDEISEYLFSLIEKIDPDEKLPDEFIDCIPLIASCSKNNLRQALNDIETCVNSEAFTEKEICELLGYKDESKEVDVVYQLATKNKSALTYIQNSEDVEGNFVYWFSIIGSVALREISETPFNEQWKEQSAQKIIATKNLSSLFKVFTETQSLCGSYFNSNIFIGKLYDYYKGSTMQTVSTNTTPIVKKIKKVSV